MESNDKRVYICRSMNSGVDRLIVAIGERAAADYVYALHRYNKIVKMPKGARRSVFLFRAAHRMREAAYFFLKDPYFIFTHGGGENIIKHLNKKYRFVPVKIPTREEYEELVKIIEK